MTCAFAVRGALRKFPGVESVEVSLNKGTATMKLKPGNNVSVEDIWKTIRNNGYTPKETKVTAKGELTASGDKLQFKSRESNRVYDLTVSPGAPQGLNEM